MVINIGKVMMTVERRKERGVARRTNKQPRNGLGGKGMDGWMDR